MDYEQAVKIAAAFTNAGMNPPEGFYFVHEDEAIVDATKDSGLRNDVDPQIYDPSYSDFVASIKPLSVRVFNLEDVDRKHPMSIVEVKEDGVFMMCPSGGGMAYTVPVDAMAEKFTVVTINLKEAQVWEVGNFSLDDTPWYEGYHTGQRWNGWAMPYFELEVAHQVAEMVHTDDYPVYYDEERDAFVNEADEDFTDIFNATEIVVDGETKKVYGIGAGSWVWTVD